MQYVMVYRPRVKLTKRLVTVVLSDMADSLVVLFTLGCWTVNILANKPLRPKLGLFCKYSTSIGQTHWYSIREAIWDLVRDVVFITTMGKLDIKIGAKKLLGLH